MNDIGGLRYATVLLLLVLLGAVGCSREPEPEGTHTLTGRGATFDEAVADVTAKLDAERRKDDEIKVQVQNPDGSYHRATPEEAAETMDLARRAAKDSLDNRSAAEVARVLDSYWRSANRAAGYDRSGFGYRITESQQLRDLSAGAKPGNDAIVGAVSLRFGADANTFPTVRVTFLTFDDRQAMRRYFERMARDVAGREGDGRTFDVNKKGYPSISLRCVHIVGVNRGVNCHYAGPDDRVIGVLFFAGGPNVTTTGPDSGIDLVFVDQDAAKRIAAVAGASWAYLNEAYYH